MDRRAFIGMVGATILPLAVEAQQAGKLYRICLIGSGTPPPPPADQASVLSERLRELGWTAERDFVVKQHAYAEMNRVPELATECIRTGVDVFVVEGATEAARVQQLTQTIPIITLRAGDLVEAGLAASLARPGGNVTGIQTLQPELVAKQISLLKEAIPRLSRAAILFVTSQPFGGIFAAVLHEAEVSARVLGITLQKVVIRGVDEVEGAFSRLQSERCQALVVVRSLFLSTHAQAVVDLALKHRLPTISEAPGMPMRGGLMSYGYNFRDTVRSAADIVDRIRRGALAGETPIQQAQTFRLVLNLKTAKALGLTIPQSVLLRANQVIE